MNKIFMETDQLSNDELQQYLSGGLSASEKHRIELIIASDPFLSDAVEGYTAANLDMTSFDAMGDRFQSQINASGSGSSSIGAWIAGAVFTTATVLGIGLANNMLNSTEIHHAPVAVQAIAEATDMEEVTDEEISAEIEAELVTAEPILDQEVITYSKKRENQPLTVASEEVQITSAPEEPETVETVLLEAVEIPKAEEVDIKTTVVSNTNIRYVHELVTVDFEDKRNWRIRVRNTTSINSGLRAYRADYSYDRNRHEQPSVIAPYSYVFYNDFLDSALYLYKVNNYRSALKAFKVMISQFPDDVNAHFYGALCYYNLGKAEKAINFLNEVLKNDVNTFDQEAQYYKALSLKQAGYAQHARDLFNKIVREGKYFAKQAQEALDNF